ncbi:MAG: gliding motility protein GldN [Bacteroidales bacterium]|nr:gliding motility protein GldN [Bacteroidales bacterium]
MKKILFCLGLFIFLTGGFTANAQSIIDADDENNFNNYYNKTLANGKQAMPYAYLRESDVVWEHAVWRVIDFREKFNQFFYFPLHDERIGTEGRVSLTDAVMKALENGEISVFKDDEFKIPFTFEEMAASLSQERIIHIAEYDEYTGDELEGRDSVVHDEFNPQDVYSARIKEYWYIDKQDTRQKVRIVGLALVYNYCRDRQDERVCENVDLFWVPMNDMHVRNALVKVYAYDENNSHAQRSYDDIFIDRYFDSFIYRESNTMNRPIAAYLTGTDAILESQAIEDKIFDIESDMWEY